MRIVMVVGTWQATNGVVTSVRTFRKGLEALGHQVRILVPAGSTAMVEPGVIALPAHLLAQDYYRWSTDPAGMAAALGDEPVDIVHAHHLFQTGKLALGLARHLGVPVVATYHTLLEGYVHYAADFLLSGLPAEPANPLAWLRPMIAAPIDEVARWYMPLHTRHLLNRFDQVVVPSRPIARLLRGQGVRGPIAIIPTGIRVKDYARKAANAELRKLGIDPKRPFVLSVGRLAKEKNIWRLLEVFAQVHQAMPEVQLVLVGPGPELAAVQAWIRERGLSGSIVLTGRVETDQLQPLYGRADVFFFPSLTDTQAIVVVEAMAAGVPAVVSDQNGPATIVKHTKTGFVCSDETEAMSQALSKLLADSELRKRQGQAAQSEALHYTVEATSRTMEGLYRHVQQKFAPGTVVATH